MAVVRGAAGFCVTSQRRYVAVDRPTRGMWCKGGGGVCRTIDRRKRESGSVDVANLGQVRLHLAGHHDGANQWRGRRSGAAQGLCRQRHTATAPHRHDRQLLPRRCCRVRRIMVVALPGWWSTFVAAWNHCDIVLNAIMPPPLAPPNGSTVSTCCSVLMYLVCAGTRQLASPTCLQSPSTTQPYERRCMLPPE